MQSMFRCLPSTTCKVAVIALLLCAGIILHFRIMAAELEEAIAPPTMPTMEELWKAAEEAMPAAGPEEYPAQNGVQLLALNLDPSLVNWNPLGEGMEILELGLARSGLNGKTSLSLAVSAVPADLIILRINPKFYEFTLHMASEDGEQRSMAEQAQRNGLVAAINGGMYLPDNLTNTGYMQSPTHTNNPRVVSKFGMFFLAGPKENILIPAALVEKSQLGEEPLKELSLYKIAVQNYRLVSTDGQVLWPESPNTHSISALAQDAADNILFILCRFQLSPADFGRLLLALPIECGPVMYLEGGSQAGLLLRLYGPSGGSQAVWRGKRNSILPLDGPPDAPIPNIIGLRPIAGPKKSEKTNVDN